MSPPLILMTLAIAAGLWAAIETNRRDVLIGYLYLVAMVLLFVAWITWVTGSCPVCPEPLP